MSREIHGLTADQWWSRINSPEAKGWPRNIGHDKGFKPSSYVFLIYDPVMDVLIAAHELVLRGFINEHELVALMEVNKKFTHKFTTCSDPPDHPKDSDAMNHYSREYNAGIRFRVIGEYDKGEKDVLWGIGLVSNFIAKGRLVVIGRNCPELVESLQTYHLKETNTKLGPDKTADDTHLPDASRYGLIGMYREIESSQRLLERTRRELIAAGRPRFPAVTPPYHPEPVKTRRRVKVRQVRFTGAHRG